MWQHIIDELETNEALGPALPVACHRHPETLEYVSKPGQLPELAPDGVYESLPKLGQPLKYVHRRMHATVRLPFELWSRVPIQGKVYGHSSWRMRW